MGNKEALLIDMDGTVADTMGGVFDYVERRYGHSLAHEDIRNYWFEDMPEKAEIMEAMRSKGFYRHLGVMIGAVRGVKRLREEYDGNVYFWSAPMAGAEGCVSEKRDWLAEHFDEDFAREAIITPDKLQALGRVAVEDSPDVIGGTYGRPVIFNQPYNLAVRLPRMYGWYDLQVIRDQMRAAALEDRP